MDGPAVQRDSRSPARRPADSLPCPSSAPVSEHPRGIWRHACRSAPESERRRQWPAPQNGARPPAVQALAARPLPHPQGLSKGVCMAGSARRAGRAPGWNGAGRTMPKERLRGLPANIPATAWASTRGSYGPARHRVWPAVHPRLQGSSQQLYPLHGHAVRTMGMASGSLWRECWPWRPQRSRAGGAGSLPGCRLYQASPILPASQPGRQARLSAGELAGVGRACIACRQGGALLSPYGAAFRKEGSVVKHFLRDVLATAAGTVLAAILIRSLGL